MKHLLFVVLAFICSNALAEGQLATLINFESASFRPDTSAQNDNVTSVFTTGVEFITPENISVYGGFAFKIGETFESALSGGARYYSSTPLFKVLVGVPVWSFLGGGITLYDGLTYYPEAGFRTALSNASRLDVFVKILNSSDDTYDKHVMIGAGITF